METVKLWKVSYMRAGWEPPLPFGKTSQCVFATSKAEAIASVGGYDRASDRFPVRASVVTEPTQAQLEDGKRLNHWLGKAA